MIQNLQLCDHLYSSAISVNKEVGNILVCNAHTSHTNLTFKKAHIENVVLHACLFAVHIVLVLLK